MLTLLHLRAYLRAYPGALLRALLRSMDTRVLASMAAVVLASGCGGGQVQPSVQDTAAPTIQPGAPGEANRELTAAELAGSGLPQHTAADVRFMQGMIVHHAQALVMAAMVGARTNNSQIHLLARRIELSQDDEMQLMRYWLEDRGEPVAMARGMDHSAHAEAEAGDAETEGQAEEGVMHGMLSPEELDRLAASSGADFDRLFLEFMIRHHEGAVAMVADLFASPRSGQEEEIFQFASHVEGDQNIEIVRMRSMLNAMR